MRCGGKGKGGSQLSGARRCGGALLALALVLAWPMAALLTEGAAAGPQATYTVTMPPERYFELGSPMALVDNGQSQGFPEVDADHSGGIVVSYLEGFWSFYGSPTFMRFNASTGAAIGGPFDIITSQQWDMWANTTARGSYSALDSQDRLVRAAWGYSMPNSSVLIKSVDLSGTQTLAQRTIGSSPAQRSAVAVAVGANDTIHTVHYDSAVRYSVMTANGTWLLRNATLANGTSTKFPPQLVFDAPAGRMIASWEQNGAGGGVVAAVEANGSVAWSRAIAMTGANLSIAATQDGGVLAVFADGSALYAVKFDRDGQVAAAQQTVVASAPNGRSPRPVALGAGEMLVVWSDVTSGGDLDVRAMALNSSDLSVTIPPTLVSDDDNPSVNPRAAVDRDGGIWVVWQNDTSIYTATVWGARIFPRWAGLSMETASVALQAVRGEVSRVPVRLSNLVVTPGEYNFTVAATPLSGPSNWSGWVETSAGVPVEGAVLLPTSTTDIVFAIDPPVADPAPYGAYVTLQAVDLHRPGKAISMTLNVSVVAGHRFEVTPADQNATALPGAPASVVFQVKNNGTMPQSGMPLALSAPPPTANWTASLQPPLLTAAPGEWVTVTLSVTPPAAARSGEAYCARLRVQNANDAFSLATAGFCVRVALLADPQVTPPSLALEVDPGVAAVTTWTLTNVGNAGAGIVCSLGVQELLPAGWSLTGSPAVSRLTGGAVTTLTIALTAPPQAQGGMQLNLTLRAGCEGSATTHDLPLEVTVRTLHVINYRTAGTAGDSNSTGAAVFSLTVENNGNVGEVVTASVDEAPPGWTASTSLTVEGAPAIQVKAFSSGILHLDVVVPAGALAASYRVVMSFQAGDQPPSAMAFTVRVPKAYGISVEFTGGPGAVAPGGTVRIVGLVAHLGNTPDTYTVRIEGGSTQYWSSEASFAADSTTDSSALVGSTLALGAFSRGTLAVNVTAPREPLAGAVTIHVMISNGRGQGAEFSLVTDVLIPELSAAFEVGPSPPGTAYPPGAATIRVAVSNRGNVEAVGVDVRMRLDALTVGVQSVERLRPGETVNLSFSVNLTAGTHQLAAEVDPLDAPNVSRVHGKVYETDEGNNVARLTLSVGSAPAPPTPARSVTTTAQASLVWVAVALALGGVGALMVVRVRLRRKPQ